MSKESNSTNPLITLLLIVVIAVVGYQTYSLKTLNERLDRIGMISEPIQSKTSPNTHSITVKRSNNPPVTVPTTQSPQHSHHRGNNYFDPFEEMQHMQHYMNRMFNRSFDRLEGAMNLDEFAFQADFDLQESNTTLTIKTSLPDVKEDSLVITIDNKNLIIKADKEDVTEERDNDGNIIRSERRRESFHKSFYLPKPVKEETLNSKINNGTLTITIEKA